MTDRILLSDSEIAMSDSWIDTICQQIAVEAQDKLMQIAEEAAKRHGALQVSLDRQNTIRIAATLAEVQDQSFILGVQMGIKVCIDAVKISERTNDEHGDAGKG